MRALALALALGAACGAAPQGPPGAAAPTTPAEVVGQVEGVLEQYRLAYQARSVAALAPLYLRGLDLIVVVQGKVLRGWPQLETELSAHFARVKEVRVELTDVAVLALGTTGAAVTATCTRSFADGVTTVDEQGILSLTLTHVDGHWRILTEHFSY